MRKICYPDGETGIQRTRQVNLKPSQDSFHRGACCCLAWTPLLLILHPPPARSHVSCAFQTPASHLPLSGSFPSHTPTPPPRCPDPPLFFPAVCSVLYHDVLRVIWGQVGSARAACPAHPCFPGFGRVSRHPYIYMCVAEITYKCRNVKKGQQRGELLNLGLTKRVLQANEMGMVFWREK